jgi:hypothetical protein
MRPAPYIPEDDFINDQAPRRFIAARQRRYGDERGHTARMLASIYWEKQLTQPPRTYYTVMLTKKQR